MIDLSYFRTTGQVKNIWAAMQVPFPELESSATLVESSKSAESFPIFSWLDQLHVVEGYFIFGIAEATSIYHPPWGYSSFWVHFTQVTVACLSVSTSLKTFPRFPTSRHARRRGTTSDSVKA